MVKLILTSVAIALLCIPMNDIHAYSEQVETVGSYKHAGYLRTVGSITEWQNSIYKKLGIPKDTMIFLRSVQNNECGDENGFCITYNKKGYTVDCGPFQINQIHKVEHERCVSLVKEGQKQVQEAIKTSDWGRVIEIRDTLYQEQVKWTWERSKGFVERFNITTNKLERYRKLGVLHNGGLFRKDYGIRIQKTYKILKSIYG